MDIADNFNINGYTTCVDKISNKRFWILQTEDDAYTDGHCNKESIDKIMELHRTKTSKKGCRYGILPSGHVVEVAKKKNEFVIYPIDTDIMSKNMEIMKKWMKTNVLFHDCKCGERVVVFKINDKNAEKFYEQVIMTVTQVDDVDYNYDEYDAGGVTYAKWTFNGPKFDEIMFGFLPYIPLK